VADEAGDVPRGEDEIGIEKEHVGAIALEELGGKAIARARDKGVSDHGRNLEVARWPAHEIEEARDEVWMMATIYWEAEEEADGWIWGVCVHERQKILRQKTEEKRKKKRMIWRKRKSPVCSVVGGKPGLRGDGTMKRFTGGEE